ncbi:small conductance mechanosensitive channel [Desulfobaculum xiamenense]|uniref:Small conductance mechanosensitive channel n=1 Tax=Desulfobaculum xiamenense TaxID=995050 RepID=A0A846QE20_9BACT|nr:mechanosensitive ion channel domain-containing protein [Desulfobaculum xiamenense]NJB66618.1 small conductance mechanosensitive channel [Desulfobaculum xiamenense]
MNPEDIASAQAVVQWTEFSVNWLMANGLRIPFALLIFYAGRWIARILSRFAGRVLLRQSSDELLASFVKAIIYYTMLAAVAIAALSHLGVNVTSLIAVFGAAGLAVGLALKDSLSNFAAGVMLVIFRPFKVGDYVLGAGVAGTVERLSIFNTELRTPDNQKVIVPNSMLTGGVITNVTANSTRRVDLVFGIGYGDDIDKAREVILRILGEESRLLADPAPVVAVNELGESSVNIVVRPWVKSTDYWDVYWALTERIKKAFDAEGISIPFPQRDVHIVAGAQG